MESQFTEESLWAAGVAARLRLLQVSFADESPPTRQKYIVEEIERALKGVVAGRTRDYLQALCERFPAWQNAPPPTAVVAGKRESLEDNPEALLEVFLRVVSQLPEDKKIQFSQKLREVGIVRFDPSEVVVEIPDDLRKRLNITANQALNLDRAVKLLAALTEWVLLLDQPVWKIWKQLAPDNNTIRAAPGAGNDLKAIAGKYLGGDPEVSTPQLAQSLEKTRKLIAGLLAGLAPAASRYAAQYIFRFSPEAIEELAKMDKRWKESLPEACWRKYLELCEGYSAATVEKELRDTVARCAEEVILGRGGNIG